MGWIKIPESQEKVLDYKIKSLVEERIIFSNPQSVIDLIKTHLQQDSLWGSLPELDREWLITYGDYVPSIVTDQVFAGVVFVSFENQAEGTWAYEIHQKIDQPYPTVYRKAKKLEELGILLILKGKKGFEPKNKIYPNTNHIYVVKIIHEIISRFYGLNTKRLFNQHTNRQLDLKKKKR